MIYFARELLESPLQKLLDSEYHGKKTPLPVVDKDDSVEIVIETALKHPRKKAVYVMDAKKGLVGIITIRTLMRNLFFSYHKPQAHSRRIIQQLTAETATDIMHHKVMYCKAEGSVEDTLHYMIKNGVYAVPVVDEKNHVTFEISMRDILRFLYKPAKE